MTTNTSIDKIIIDEDKLKVIEACVENKQPVLLVGETGTGKTTIIRELAKHKSKTLVRVNLNGSTSVEEIKGKWLVNKQGTYWQDGILTSAMRSGDWIVFDEINAALPDILFTLHSLLDDDRTILLDEKDNEQVVPHDEFRFFATMNPTHEYAGTKELNGALKSRFASIINIEPIHQVEESQFLQTHYGVDTAVAEKLTDIANILRETKKAGRISYFCSTRDIINAAMLEKTVGFESAVQYSIHSRMDDEELKYMTDNYSNFTSPSSKPKYMTLAKHEDMLRSKNTDIKTLESNLVAYKAEIDKLEAEVKANKGSLGFEQWVDANCKKGDTQIQILVKYSKALKEEIAVMKQNAASVDNPLETIGKSVGMNMSANPSPADLINLLKKLSQ